MNAIIPAEISNGALMSFIERASRDTEFDVAKFGELLKLQRDMEHERARRAFNIAMSEAQTEMLPVVRDSKNDHLRNKYAKLETIDSAIRPIYTRHGFSVRYGSAPAPLEGHIRITCTVAHAAGYFEESYLDSPTGNAGSQGGRTATTPVQAVGSAVTYLRRYLLSMVFNVVTVGEDDDDGEAMRRQAETREARVAKAAAIYDTGASVKSAPPGRTEDQWKAWLERLRQATEGAAKRAAVVEIGGRQSVADALASAPDWVKDDIRAMLADAFGRMPEEAAEPEAVEADDSWPGPKP